MVEVHYLQDPIELLQKLIRFDTTNPPGGESEIIAYINQLLNQAGIETRILAKSPERPNLIARLAGQGNAAPLMMYGHVDVVTTENQPWQHPPFAGEQVDGFIWGRGSLDMKSGIAMMLTAFLRARVEGLKPPGDILLVILSDEEAGGDFGAKFLVEEHFAEFAGVRYALGEFGGFTLHISKRRFYPIQVAEKQVCWFKVTFHGPGGHGSLSLRGGAMAKLARFLDRLDRFKLPVHVTNPAKMTFKPIASTLGGIPGLAISLLLNPMFTESALRMLGERGNLFAPLLHNTVNATILHGSSKINVIPGEVSVELDGRLLPGFTPEDLFAELRELLGSDAQVEIVRYDSCPSEPDMGLFDTLADILREADPHGVPIPMMLSAVTDGRFFSRLGIQTYGFLPMQLPEDFNFTQTIHGANERIPISALQFGSDAIYQALNRFGV